jgi:hypothetical protein
MQATSEGQHFPETTMSVDAKRDPAVSGRIRPIVVP